MAVVEMIRDDYHSSVNSNYLMEIVQDKEPGKPQIRPPEGAWNPGVEVIVIRRRAVICDYRRAFVDINVVYIHWVRVEPAT